MAEEGFLGGLKSKVLDAFSTEVEDEKFEQEVKSVSKPVVVSPVSVQPSQGMTPERMKELDTRFQTFLDNQVQNDGASLIKELEDILETLVEPVPDEGLRIKTALKQLLKRGHDARSILADFDKRLQTLDASKKTIETSTSNELSEKASKIEELVNSLREQIVSKQYQIQVLQNEISALETQKSQKESEFSVEKMKIEQGQNRFAAVFGERRNKIQSARDKIASFSIEGNK